MKVRARSLSSRPVDTRSKPRPFASCAPETRRNPPRGIRRRPRPARKISRGRFGTKRRPRRGRQVPHTNHVRLKDQPPRSRNHPRPRSGGKSRNLIKTGTPSQPSRNAGSLGPKARKARRLLRPATRSPTLHDMGITKGRPSRRMSGNAQNSRQNALKKRSRRPRRFPNSMQSRNRLQAIRRERARRRTITSKETRTSPGLGS